MTLPDSEVFAEWLAVNRLGCFAMGTPCRLPQRKYHGLLVARSSAASEPWHTLAETSESLRIGANTYDLGSFSYGDCIHPQGYLYQVGFHPSPPTWRYRCGEATIIRQVRLAERARAVRIEYHIEAAPRDGLELTVSPLFTGRSAHHVGHESTSCSWRESADGAIEVSFADPRTTVRLRGTGQPQRLGDSYWNRQVQYPEERRRGYPEREDLYRPVGFRWQLRAGSRVAVTVSLDDIGDEAWDDAALARASLAAGGPVEVSVEERLARAAADYVIETDDGRASVIAGYPWFGEWGRDALIALPGLTLARGEPTLAGRVLDHFAAHRKDGLIPNIIGPDLATTNTDSVDATLFFVRAVRAVEEAAGPEVASRWWPTVLELLEVIREGRVPGVHVTREGLLSADRRPRALTWMDAIVDGEAVTPRAPFAVEIQALFHDAANYGLRIVGRLPSGTGASEGPPPAKDLAVHWQEIVAQLERNFESWFACRSHLADSTDGTLRDTAVRPNQLFALIGLRPLVRGPLARGVLASVRRCLLTPVGLRTLDPEDPRYRGRCEGSQRERDLAYHQGTVWPWLLGPYVDAVAAVEGATAARAAAASIVDGFRGHMDRACWGHVSEIFDGAEPHYARGAPAQAWSVAELLRIARTYR
ncbi:MAG: amylo-alpha-1,6-glucosidase [Planctomycetota bacterium]